MQDQPKIFPQRGSSVFPDGRSARPQVNGTIARSQGDETSYFMTGMVDAKEADGMPLPVTMDLLKRGQERFNIYCTPCHSRVGNGKGMIVQRGYYPATDFHSERLRQAPLGHFFSVITNGYGAMPTYAAELEPQDRWAVVAYIRALQLSQHAQPEDAPAGVHIAPLDQIVAKSGFPAGFAKSGSWNQDGRPTQARTVASSRPVVAQPNAAAAATPTGSTASTIIATSRKKPEAGNTAKAAPPPAVHKANVAAGEKAYMGNCVACHQPTRAGLPPLFPSLVGIVPRVGEERIRAVVTDGIPTAKPPMPSFGEKLSPDDIDDLVAFLKTTPK